jgi:hypothetical protein
MEIDDRGECVFVDTDSTNMKNNENDEQKGVESGS